MNRKSWFALCLALGLFAALGFLLAGAAQAAEVPAAPEACVPGPHTGVITISEEWCLADSPHILTGDVTVNAGVILTIEPGVVVRGQPQAGDDGTQLRVLGILNAVGTAADPILFTSVADSGPGQWGGIVFDGGTGTLSYVTVRYAGLGNHANVIVRNVATGFVRIENSQVVTQSSTMSPATDYGLYVENSQVRVLNTQFAGNGDGVADYGVYATGASTGISLTQLTVNGNAGTGIGIANGARAAINRSNIRGNALHGVQASGAASRLTMTAGTISQQGDDGLNIPSGLSVLSIVGTRFVANAGDGIDYSGAAVPWMRYATIFGNTGFGMVNRNPAVCADAKVVYWGDLGGPNDASAANDGCMGPVMNVSPSGDEVSDDVLYAPWVGGTPTSTLAGPTRGAVLQYTDAQGLRTAIDIPPGATNESLIYVLTPRSGPSQPLPAGWGWAGHSFDLISYGSGTYGSGVTFLTPVVITVEYSNSDLGNLPENSLRLYYNRNGIWEDVATSCSPPSSYVRNLAQNSLSVPICHTTEFALAGEKQVLLYYLPIIWRNAR